MLNISEIFFSLQGESTYSGLPCIFIRLAGCNLRCVYCDAQYSYETKSKLTLDEILLEVKKFYPIELVEVTGGEPLLQPETNVLLKRLHDDGYKVLLETNGSIDLWNVPKSVVKIVDVKTPGSGEEASFFYKNLDFITSDDQIKFVLNSLSDYDFAKDFLKNNKSRIKTKEIIFSTVKENFPPAKLADLIIHDKLNVRLQLQIHKYLNIQ